MHPVRYIPAAALALVIGFAMPPPTPAPAGEGQPAKNLSGADLRGKNLAGADLRGADLSGAILVGVALLVQALLFELVESAGASIVASGIGLSIVLLYLMVLAAAAFPCHVATRVRPVEALRHE